MSIPLAHLQFACTGRHPTWAKLCIFETQRSLAHCDSNGQSGTPVKSKDKQINFVSASMVTREKYAAIIVRILCCIQSGCGLINVCSVCLAPRGKNTNTQYQCQTRALHSNQTIPPKMCRVFLTHLVRIFSEMELVKRLNDVEHAMMRLLKEFAAEL